MKLLRRRFLQMGVCATALPAMLRFASAQAYPTRSASLIVPYAPGGSSDILARLIGQWLSERLDQPFVIEHRPGAGNNIGTEAVVKASADGHTLLMVSTAHAINPALYTDLHFNFIRDIAPVAGFIRSNDVMLVNPSFPAKTVPEFIDHAKANAGKISFATGGNGSVGHVTGELLKMLTSVNMVHAPYRGIALALTDLIGGKVQVIFATLPATIEAIKAGTVRALAVTTAMRSEVLPDVPTMGEFVHGFEASSWYGIGVPKDTPAEIVDKLNKEINASLVDSKIKARLKDLGSATIGGTPGDFGKLIAEETEKWATVVKFSGVKA